MFRLWCFFLNSFGCLPFVPSFVYSLWQFEGNWRQVFHWRNKSMCLVILYGELYRTTIWMRSFYGQLPVPQPTNQPTNQISRSSDQELRRFGFGENFTATLSWILRGWNSSKDTVDLIKKGGGLVEMPWIVPYVNIFWGFLLVYAEDLETPLGIMIIHPWKNVGISKPRNNPLCSLS